MRLIHHSTHIHQERAQEAALKAQDEAFFDAQLLRAISLTLSSVGFDSVKPTALEAFRGEVEQCMAPLHLHSSCAALTRA
jgi:transcription initiation factor TFIID subunit 8